MGAGSHAHATAGKDWAGGPIDTKAQRGASAYEASNGVGPGRRVTPRSGLAASRSSRWKTVSTSSGAPAAAASSSQLAPCDPRSPSAATGGTFTASPVAADGRLFIATEEGDVFVVRAGRQYDLLATNTMGEVVIATPAISDGVLLVRTLKNLYGLGEGASASPKAP